MVFIFPLMARYTHYLSARYLDKVITRWGEKPQGQMLKITDAMMRIGLPDGEGGVDTRRPRKAILERSKDFYGSVWSAKCFGVSFTDLLASAESLIASHSFTTVLFLGFLIPLLMTIILGRVFCGWICPMALIFEIGEKCRKWLKKYLEISPLKIEFWSYNKYILLLVGLCLVFIVGYPILHYIYPPAIISREVHSYVMFLFDQAERGEFKIFSNGFGISILFLLMLLLIEIFIAPRFWCRAFCPGGALYSWLSVLKIFGIRRQKSTCTDCTLCDKVCPMSLSPMTDKIGLECDQCGICVDVCPERSLSFKWHTPKVSIGSKKFLWLRATGLFILLVFLTVTLQGHHILGIPHYAYEESYPQVPVLKLSERLNDWQIDLTGYPGKPKPGERSQLYVYIKDMVNHHLYDKPLTIVICKKTMLGNKLVYGPVSQTIDENVFKFYLKYPSDGNYEVTLSVEAVQGISTVTFPIVIGKPGSPWRTLIAFMISILSLVLVIRAIRIKRARKMLCLSMQ